MDMHREKTSEILESHKKEMCSVVEKARVAEGKIDLLEKELDRYQQVLDDQKVKIFGQDEELEKLRKEQAAKDKKIKDFDNVKKSLIVEKNRAKDDAKKMAEEMRELKNELDKEKKSNQTLRGKVRRETERTEDLEYKLRELENQHYDDQIEMESLQDRNNVLTYKVDDLLGEVSYLKEKLTKQESLALPPQSTSAMTVEANKQVNHSPPAEKVGSCSSFSVLTESPFSVMSSTIESPKGCSPVPIGASRAHCSSLGKERRSLLSPEITNKGMFASDARYDIFDNISSEIPPVQFSRTIHKEDGGLTQREAGRGLRNVFEDCAKYFQPPFAQDNTNISPAYNPWGPSSYAGFSSASLLGSSNGRSTLFNILPSNFSELPNGLFSACTAPPALGGINIGSASGQCATLNSSVDGDLNNNLGGVTAAQNGQGALANCISTTTGTSIPNGGGDGLNIHRRQPVRRSLDFSDLGVPFYA
ncbi:hypothetical protein BIW11_06094 [Tropilaelaps mercedesae]|uniref:Uncharacterized protein n=1 Tax=Tropilaelaps mercedesae TaxID=418985 RepID=A0A1V9XZL1_9ACAR|nr:hypothetical protein BIW11_06094 [Tropilaelaps mercedesae]